MQLVCVRPFGNFKPGDEVEVPDGAVFDKFYFEVSEPDKPEPDEPADKGKGK